MSFSFDLKGVTFDFATLELVPGTPGSLTVQAFEDEHLVSTTVFNSTVPPGHPGGKGVASITGTFNRLVLTGDKRHLAGHRQHQHGSARTDQHRATRRGLGWPCPGLAPT
jgi:hypothetical protein